MDTPINALDLSPADLLARCRPPVVTYVPMTVATQQLIAGDQYRILLWFLGPTSQPAFISTDPNTAAPAKPGIQIPNPTQYWPVMTYWEYGPLVNQAWYGYGSAGSTLGVGYISLNVAGPLLVEPTHSLQAWYRAAVPSGGVPAKGPLARFWRRLTGRQP